MILSILVICKQVQSMTCATVRPVSTLYALCNSQAICNSRPYDNILSIKKIFFFFYGNPLDAFYAHRIDRVTHPNEQSEARCPKQKAANILLCRELMAVSLKGLLSVSTPHFPSYSAKLISRSSATKMAMVGSQRVFNPKIIDSHLHVWASSEEAAEKYPYFPGQEPSLPGNVDFLLQCMGEAAVDGALIVQPINHKFDHSLVTSVLKKYPSKFVGCCLANPSEDGNGINQLEHLILKDGYRAVRFNPYLWPSGQLMTNEVGRAMFSKAGELGAPVGFMCMKGLNLHIAEIEELCSAFPSTVVLLDHLAFCKPPTNGEEEKAFSALLKLSRFPQVYVKFSALFRVSRKPFPYEDICHLLSQIVSSFGANRVMWGSDFPFVVPECGYKEAKEVVSLIASQVPLQTSDLEWIMGKTVLQLFPNSWIDS